MALIFVTVPIIVWRPTKSPVATSADGLADGLGPTVSVRAVGGARLSTPGLERTNVDR